MWQLGGVSVIPIKADQTKRPAVRWKPYMATAPTLNEVEAFWANGDGNLGLAVICGAVSDSLEMTEIEGRAVTPENITEIVNRLDEAGYSHVWDYLNGSLGYVEQSPSGGRHYLYRIGDHEVPGNTKIASTEDNICLAETRGEGGYVIVAPTSGLSHPSGTPWTLISGEYGQLPVISWQERNALHEAIQATLDCPSPDRAIPTHPDFPSQPVPTHVTPAPPDYPLQPTAGHPNNPAHTYSTQLDGPNLASTGHPVPLLPDDPSHISPFDDFEARTDWGDASLLGGLGWQIHSQKPDGSLEWTRDGKSVREGSSATTGRDRGRDRLWVFSTSTIFRTQETITKGEAYAVIHHGGDRNAAAVALRRRGYGTTAPIHNLDDFHHDGAVVETPEPFNDTGNARRLWARVHARYRWVDESKIWYVYDGRTWNRDYTGELEHAFQTLADDMRMSTDDALSKWGLRSGNQERINSAIKVMRSMPGATVQLNDFDAHRGILNVNNGVLNLRTGEFAPRHDPQLMLTKLFNASYDPQATCPEWEAFMEQALPDERLRTYVQRALGYSMLGDADQRALFLIHGPSGTGKSTMLETIHDIFGTYGETAPAGTFKTKLESNGPTPDLHTLRGRRFVSTSETAETASFDEDLLKRLTGRDSVQSRGLFESNVKWTPQCVIWLATNNPPRLSSDDDAIWRRLKLIPFVTKFLGKGEVPDMARRILMPERNGILNWLLAGLRDFTANGLQEPEDIPDRVQELRLSSDSVARFLDDSMSEGLYQNEVAQVEVNQLYGLYLNWSKRMGERSPVGKPRFLNRLTSNFPWVTLGRIDHHRMVVGLGYNAYAGRVQVKGPPG